MFFLIFSTLFATGFIVFFIGLVSWQVGNRTSSPYTWRAKAVTALGVVLISVFGVFLHNGTFASYETMDVAYISCGTSVWTPDSENIEFTNDKGVYFTVFKGDNKVEYFVPNNKYTVEYVGDSKEASVKCRKYLDGMNIYEAVFYLPEDAKDIVADSGK